MLEEGRLAGPLSALHRSQLEEWATLARGQRFFEAAIQRSLELDGFEIEIQLNLGRAPALKDWTRVGDPGSCFLCPSQRPQVQRALAAAPFELLCNPAPLFPEHYTVVWPEHGPRPVAGHLPELLELAQALGPAYSLFFNGPHAGASAPDHLHFQAFTAGRLPLERELLHEQPPRRGLLDSWSSKGLELFLVDALGRGVLLARGPEAGAVAGAIGRGLRALAPEGSEPDANLLARSAGGRFACALLPRRAHRPACFFAAGEEQVRVSPGAADLAGLLILTRAEDLHRLTPDRIRTIYREVALSGAELAERLGLSRLGRG